MIIEYPEAGPVQVMELAADRAAARPKYHTIGEFYDAIRDTLIYLVNEKKAKITPGLRQITEELFPIDREYNAVKPINTLDDALKAIKHIKEQGEGTPSRPDAPMFGHELAHYYKFKQIQVGRLYKLENKSWTLSGSFFDFPEVYPMADIPGEGYENMPEGVATLIKTFNDEYKKMLASLQFAWEKGGAEGQGYLSEAENVMRGLRRSAVELMQTAIDAAHPEKGNYGPTFRVS
jgi:Ferritin-like